MFKLLNHTALYTAFFTLFLFIAVPSVYEGKAYAQKVVTNAPPTDTTPDAKAGNTSEPPDPKGDNSSSSKLHDNIPNPFSSVDFLLSIFVLFFGLVVVTFEVYLAHAEVITSDHFFKCIILTLVITAAVVLITAGYSSSQITGATGILGSIAGYMLGKTKLGSKHKKEKNATTCPQKD